MLALSSGSSLAWRASFFTDVQVRFLPLALPLGYPGSIPGQGVFFNLLQYLLVAEMGLLRRVQQTLHLSHVR